MVKEYSHIALYVWHPTFAPKDRKMGVHWIALKKNGKRLTRKEANDHTQSYIDGSLGRYSVLAQDRGQVITDGIWDVTEYAEKHKLTGAHDKLDDYIRGKAIGFRTLSADGQKTLRGDWHTGLSSDEICAAIQKELIKEGQALPILSPNVLQYIDAVEILAAIKNKFLRILAELATRYGKTNFAGMLIRELDSPLTVVASYVLGSFASFENEFTKWEQFKDFVLVDSSIKGFEEKVKAGLRGGEQVVVYLGMCDGDLRKDRIKFLFNRKERPFLIIDEADYGVHCENQADALKEYRQENDALFAMTGSNGDRAARPWDINYYIRTGYNDMVAEKHFPVRSIPTGLKHFDVDMQLIQQVVDVNYFQMDMAQLADDERTKNPELFEEDGKFLPSLTKWSKNPVKASHFGHSLIKSVYGHATNSGRVYKELDINFQLQSKRQSSDPNSVTVDMWWLPGNTRTANLILIGEQFKEALPDGYRVMVLSGANGHTNRTAEQKATEFIKRAKDDGKKHVVLVTSTIASRSFSVKEISRIFLAFDGGSLASTTQKMARGYTSLMSDLDTKIASVISLSFDPQRDDKFDGIFIEAVANAQKRHPEVKDIYQLWEEVLKTNPCYLTTEDGARLIKPDEYLKLAQNRHSLHRILGTLFVVGDLDEEVQEALLEGNGASFLKATARAAEKGKTSDTKRGKILTSKGHDEKKDRESKVKDAVTMISENLDILVNYAGRDRTYDEVFAFMDLPAHKGARDAVKDEFGVDYEIIKYLVLEGKMKRILLDLGRKLKS